MTELFLQARVAVIPIGARLDDRNFVNEGRTRLDPRKADAGNAVHLERQDQPVPMYRAILVEIVDDPQPRLLPFLQADERSGDRAVDPDRPADLAIDAHRLPRDPQHDLLARHGRQLRLQPGRDRLRPGRKRSEEHTSELQSLMRISYAVFCLKKKKITIISI